LGKYISQAEDGEGTLSFLLGTGKKGLLESGLLGTGKKGLLEFG